VALEFAGRVEDPGQKGRVQSILAKTQAQAGDIAGAIQTANLNLEAPPIKFGKASPFMPLQKCKRRRVI